MKNQMLWAFCPVVSVMFLSSCGEIAPVQEEQFMSSVSVRTRGTDENDLIYPICVMAFGEDGLLCDRQLIESDDYGMSLQLPQGRTYNIVAVSAKADDYSIVDAGILSKIRILQTGHSTPLQMGQASVLPLSAVTSVHIQMNYCVASLNISLSGLPEECRNVSVTVNSIYESMDLNGGGSGSSVVVLPCVRTETGWNTESGYLLPGNTQQTVFTICYDDDEGGHFCSATYPAPLKKGVPYLLAGSYCDGNVNVSGSFETSGWENPIILDFRFGPDMNPVIGGDDPDSEDSYYVSSLPSSCSLWNGHVVVKSDTTSATSATLTLMSLSDWDGVTSAMNEVSPGMAMEIACGYQELGLDMWSIPSEAEARLLVEAFQKTDIAGQIESASGDSVSLVEKSKNVRYLCDNSQKTFSFNGGSITPAGAKVDNYHLRLVRTVNVYVR